MNLEKNDLEMKRKSLNMTKYGNCKRDRVDLILVSRLSSGDLFISSGFKLEILIL
ncbi:hypothetical protein N302_13063, partial [Corvus brachyrhynchos]